MYCNCKEPSLVTNSALGAVFQVCKLCKLEHIAEHRESTESGLESKCEDDRFNPLDCLNNDDLLYFRDSSIAPINKNVAEYWSNIQLINRIDWNKTYFINNSYPELMSDLQIIDWNEYVERKLSS